MANINSRPTRVIIEVATGTTGQVWNYDAPENATCSLSGTRSLQTGTDGHNRRDTLTMTFLPGGTFGSIRVMSGSSLALPVGSRITHAGRYYTVARVSPQQDTASGRVLNVVAYLDDAGKAPTLAGAVTASGRERETSKRGIQADLREQK